MRTPSVLASILSLLLVGGLAAAAEDTAPAKPVTKPYPLTTCIVSDEKLGEMGEPVVVVRDGQEVKFCCKGCVKQFEKDPAPFLKKIADASATKGAAPAPAAETPAAK